jgi:hypothetical protein
MPVTIRTCRCIETRRHPDGKLKSIRVERGSWRFWVPFFAVDKDSEVWNLNSEGDLIIQTWKARELGLEVD